MERFIKQMSIYHQYHQKLITRISHYIGVPLIVFSLMIVLGWLQFGITEVFTTQLDWLLIAALVIYYLFFEIVIGLSTGVVLVILNVLAGLRKATFIRLDFVNRVELLYSQQVM